MTSKVATDDIPNDPGIVPIVSALLAVMIWAGNTVVARMSNGAMSAATISCLRWIIAGVAITPWLALPTWRNRVRVLEWTRQLLTLSLLGMVLCQALVYLAAAQTSATHIGIIFATTPILTILTSAALTRRLPSAGALGGTVISLIGLSYLLSHGAPSRLLTSGLGWADGLVLLSALCYAMYGLLLRRWSIPLPTWQLLYLQIIVAACLTLPWYLWDSSKPDAIPFSWRASGLILYAGIGGSLAAPYFYLRSIQSIGPAKSSLMLNLMPVFVALVAGTQLGETIGGPELIGGAVAIGGVVLGQLLGNRVAR
ncbi:EamA family transporter [Cupriavidus sp. 2SB]|uniref:DMT family transporter n=1 Tax=Cupriavidus sp. 2SB TaxID=2502199 RepID=UPI0010F67989|nr:EamA family transporter [Cupriavidus sp. 2SB]